MNLFFRSLKQFFFLSRCSHSIEIYFSEINYCKINFVAVHMTYHCNGHRFLAPLIYFIFIVVISFIGGGNRATWRKP